MKYKLRTARHYGKWQGMNWIRQEKRLAIYLRDGLACVYCGQAVEESVMLTLDHLKPARKGGNNHERNLVTCCEHCNKSRHDRSLSSWVKAVARYVNDGIRPHDILKHINKCTNRKLPMDEARAMIERRGSALKALKYMTK